MPSTRSEQGQAPERASRDGQSRPRLPVWKKVLFSAVVFLVFFGMVELVLLVCGVKPLLYEEDPYVGFSSQIPLFVEQEGAQMETARNKLRFFNPQQFAKRKDGEVTRVFCVGGSTTYGRPFDDQTSFCGWLRGLLPAADPSREWEIINAGGISYASYRVAALMEELADYDPDIFIVYSGQNEFLERRTYSGIIDMPAPVRGLTALLSNTRTYSATARLVRGLGKEPQTGDGQSGQLEGEVNAILDQSVGLDDYERDTELAEQVLAHYRYNLARMVDIAKASGAKILFVTPASNLRNCSPFKSQPRDGLTAEEQQRWGALMESARSHLEGQRSSEALADLDAAAKIDDQYAELHFLRGRALDALDRSDEARDAYWRALDEDVCPLRALSPMRGIVAEVARERAVPLVDFAAIVEKESPQGIAGEELFLDHVHPTIAGHRMLALAIIDEMVSQQWLSPSSEWGEAAIERVASSIMEKVDPKMQGVAMRNL